MASIKLVRLDNVRLGPWPDIFKPGTKPNTRGEFKYKATAIFEPESPAHQVAKAALMEVAEKEYGANWMNVLRAMEGSKKCLRNGDTALDKNGLVRPGFAGQWYVSASNVMKPKVVGGKRGPDGQFAELLPEGGRPYGGCYINMLVEISAMKAFGDAPNNIYAKLIAIQYIKDGEAFGGARPTSAEGFDELEDAEEPAGATAGGSADDLFN